MKKCTKCKTIKPLELYYNCKRVKDGKASKCKVCSNREAKIYMRKTRIARRLRKFNLYDGVLSRLDIEKLSTGQMTDLIYKLSRELLYSAQSSRFCIACEKYHTNLHKKI